MLKDDASRERERRMEPVDSCSTGKTDRGGSPISFFRKRKALLAGMAMLGLVASLLAGFKGYIDSLARVAVTVPPHSYLSITPALAGIPYEDWTTTSKDGLKLAAWFIPAEGAPRKPPLIVVHGLGASKEFQINYIVLGHRLGFPVLAIDLRGHGKSEKTMTTLGGKEPLDLKAWTDKLGSKGYSSPLVWGTSLGAVTALRFVSEDPRARGVVADAPFDNLRNSLAVHARLFFGLPAFPFVDLVSWELERLYSLDPSKIDCVEAVEKIHVPILILAAEDDRRMPVGVVRKIYDAASEPKRWWVIPHSSHEERTFAPDFCHVVGDFLEFAATYPGQKH
ncbi:alpha/beta hydrolase [Verrucomicrobium sp. 3C]|uniref:alpha/beta hydrolase n=1 Tax=Verrucomicrobium sp. 3C TaxID=1134055 RepID=UPI0003AA6E03|nr:alpha/beta fold hydrolase [Verrucomicrobium sp. 3C]